MPCVLLIINALCFCLPPYLSLSFFFSLLLPFSSLFSSFFPSSLCTSSHSVCQWLSGAQQSSHLCHHAWLCVLWVSNYQFLALTMTMGQSLSDSPTLSCSLWGSRMTVSVLLKWLRGLWLSWVGLVKCRKYVSLGCCFQGQRDICCFPSAQRLWW